MADDGKVRTLAKPGEQLTPGSIWLAAAVHAFTASGVLCALFATLAMTQGAYPTAFAWLGVALVIDGIDGTFARMVHVSRRLPRFSGERLDNVVDYVTYVFVPTLALLHARILDGAFGVALAGCILMSSLFHFSDNASKTEDHCFVGFPAIWNIVAFYLFAFQLPVWASALVVLVCSGLTFVPMRWLHPMRVERHIGLNIAGCVLWLTAAASTFWTGFPAAFWAQAILLAVGAYSIALTVIWPWADTSKGKA